MCVKVGPHQSLVELRSVAKFINEFHQFYVYHIFPNTIVYI